ncbi:MAG: hypothetical protein AVDCRST_MAG38-1673 [uncultured Solirubrobacteraceae bacterium]|uniref:Orc1-like AAA ATPase domain-containing protein n=1 Tax=uncultured Solirubrobacteraceae bacterium TaxID=1162706 RepID=A0A6J4RKQ1_9ACTN|nr:MAG: hypothetical protein AVDCRST_MAG38-1673 [uncultured Solirubrobacteraceae bacterium]
MASTGRGLQGTPFRFEGPVSPELLIDRQAELAALARRAGDRVGVRLAAPRRFGKTSLLVAHAAQLRETGWRTAHVDLGRVSDLTDVARRLASAYGALDVSWLRAHLGGLLARLGLSIGPTGASITFGPRPILPDAEAAELVLHRLLDLPVMLHEREGTPTLVVFDEFQDLLVAREDLDGLLRSRIQYHGDAAAYVYAGSEPSMMRELFDRRERPLFGQADPLALGPLPPDAVVTDLSERFAGEGLDPGEALGELAAFAGGHPQRVMLLSYLLAEQLEAGRPGTPETAERVIDAAVERAQPAHEALWSQLRRSEKVVLAGVADGLPPSSPALAQEHQLGRNTLHEAAERLIDQGHLTRGKTGVRVIDPLLREWLRRR